jgi:RHS repeat-associated protein
MNNRTLVYNQNNRLIQVEEGEDVLGEYTYNGLEQRVIKKANGVTTIFHYGFNAEIVGESSPDGTFQKEYLYHGSSRTARFDTQSGDLYYYLNDHLGTPQLMTDDQGTTVWQATHRPFGGAEVNTDATIDDHFRFPGQYYDEETGLHYNHHRYYDSRTGRYLRPDPSHFTTSKGDNTPYVLPLLLTVPNELNLYHYVQNSPINHDDPDGLFIRDTVVFIDSIIKATKYADVQTQIGERQKWLDKQISKTKVGSYEWTELMMESIKLLKLSKEVQAGGLPHLRDAVVAAYGLPGTLTGGLPPQSMKDFIIGEIASEAGRLMGEIKIPTVPGNVEKHLPLKWNPHNPKFIDKPDAILLDVYDGKPPFTWSISGGQGISLGAQEAGGRSIAVQTSASASGTAEIAVIDGNNDKVSGTITAAKYYYIDDDYYFHWFQSWSHNCRFYHHRTVYSSFDDSVVSEETRGCVAGGGPDRAGCLARAPINKDFYCNNVMGYTMCTAGYCQDAGPECSTDYWCYGHSGVYE